MLSSKYKSGTKFEIYATPAWLARNHRWHFPPYLNIFRSHFDVYNPVFAKGTEFYVMDSTM